MCDYSFDPVAFRLAAAGDKLVSARFNSTPGFAAAEKPNVATCLLPGTEVAFEREVTYARFWRLLPKRTMVHRTARFRCVHLAARHAHHEALEFPDGKLVPLARLCVGQALTVLQLPVEESRLKEQEERIGSIASDPAEADLPTWLSRRRRFA